MAVFEIQGADGKTYEVEAATLEAAANAMKSFAAPSGGVSTDSGAVDDLRDKARAAATGAANSMSFGFGDNIAGAIGGVGSMTRGQGFKRGYDETLDIAREGMANDRQQSPLAYNGGSLAGAVVPSLALSPFATGSSLLGTMGRGAGLGALEGGLLGGGLADGENVGLSAAKGAGIGSAIGLLAPPAIYGAAATANAVADPLTGLLESLFKTGNLEKANRAIAKAIRSSGKSPAELESVLARAASEGQPEYRLMDALGVPGQRQASGVARTGGDAAAEIADYLGSRQAGQSERVAGFLDEGFGFRGQPYVGAPGKPGAVLARPRTTAADTVNKLKSTRSETATKAYDAARGNAAPVDVRGALDVIDSRIGGMRGSNITGDGIDAKLSRYRSRLAADPAPNGELSRELSDFDRVLGVKQAVQDDIGAAVRAGRNNEARELGKLVTELDAALEAASDMYRTANDGFRTASGVIDAVEQGADMSRPSRRAADTTARFSSMTPDQQQAARTGYGDSLMARLEANASPTTNNAKPLLSPKRIEEARTMAINPDVYGRRLARETEMWEVQNRALGGSRTADNIEDINGTRSAASGLIGAGRSAANFQLGDAVAQIGSVLGAVGRGQTDQTRQLIVKALLSNDPKAAIEPVLRQYNASQQQRRFIEAILRGVTREPAVSSVR